MPVSYESFKKSNQFSALIYFQTLPHDNQKVRNLLGGSLYAYELPPVEDIEPITAEEETLEKKSNIGLSEIQRGISSMYHCGPITC